MVRRRADHLQGREVLARHARHGQPDLHRLPSNVTTIETPDDDTVVIHTKQPDARIVGGLFVYMIPEHVYGKEPVKKLTGSYQPQLPLVGSGPFIVTEFERGRIVKMERNPNLRGKKPKFDEIQFIKYGTTDAVSGRSSSARST